MVAIIDYGMGNVASVQKALNALGIKNAVTSESEMIKTAEFIVLPGVGSFMQGMKNLRDRGLDLILTEEIMVNKKHFLGICLGMQLIMENGSEPVPCKGLGWIEGSVIKIDQANLRVPHMGWNDIRVVKDKFYKEVQTNDFYFIHSYHVKPVDETVIAATVTYGEEIVASIEKENIFATQFHPEKSQTAGLSVLKNFFNQRA